MASTIRIAELFVAVLAVVAVVASTSPAGDGGMGQLKTVERATGVAAADGLGTKTFLAAIAKPAPVDADAPCYLCDTPTGPCFGRCCESPPYQCCIASGGECYCGAGPVCN